MKWRNTLKIMVEELNAATHQGGDEHYGCLRNQAATTGAYYPQSDGRHFSNFRNPPGVASLNYRQGVFEYLRGFPKKVVAATSSRVLESKKQ